MVNNGPSKISGHWHTTKGSMKETIGNITRLRSLARSGANEHAAGQTELQAAKGKGYAMGTKERALGKKDQVVGAVTGDYAQENAGRMRGAKGERQQAWNRVN